MAAALQTAPSPSPQALWMALILSTDLQMPLHDQSKDAAHTFPACFFHSQSAHTRRRAWIKSQNQQRHRSSTVKLRSGGQEAIVPGGVAQQRLRSSTCSTSSPRSHAPSDTSSFANRCRIGLRVVFAVQA